MTGGRLAAVFLVASFASAALAGDLLIVQLKFPLVNGEDPNLPLAPYVAEELDKDGRVRPVVWSMTDPVFREWVNRDVFGPFEPNPSFSRAMDTARRLGVSHVLTVQAKRTQRNFVPAAELYVDGRSRWRFGPRDPDKSAEAIVSTDGRYDEKATRELKNKLTGLLGQGEVFTVTIGGIADWDATARAVASTWKAVLGDGPLSGFPPRPRLDGGPQDAGATGGADHRPDLATAKSEDVVTVAQGLVAKGQVARAVTLMREACDLRPLDPKTRSDFANVLLSAGMPLEAAEAALAAARLPGAPANAWLLCASAWASAGDAEMAGDALKEAQSRGLEGPEVDRVAAGVALLKDDPARAALLYSKFDDRASMLSFAVAKAILGDREACDRALRNLQEPALSTQEYTSVMIFAERGLARLQEAARSVVPEARVNPGDKATLSLAADTVARSEGLRTLVEALVPPTRFSGSHEARKLAHILLAQAVIEAQKFAETNDPDIAEEALASLGQALRLFETVREKFELEKKYSGA